MRKPHNQILTGAAVLLAPLAAAQLSNAQITNEIEANISHPFIIGNTTLPPGEYHFRMLPDSNMTIMTVRSADDKLGEEFLVRRSIDQTMPKHSELVFNRYGDKEFLSKIYEGGSRTGVAVEEPSRQELRLQKQNQQPTEHTESQSSE
jgi:hypothetical protein